MYLISLTLFSSISWAVDVKGTPGPDNIKGTATDDDITGHNGDDIIDGLQGSQ